jgi:glycosyltransferase involved in cell wall biosynthesis
MIRAAVLLDSSLCFDRRGLLEIESLRTLKLNLTLYTVIEDDLPSHEDENHFHIRRIFRDDLWSYKQREHLTDLANKISKEKFDIIHCHDHQMLQIGVLIKQKNPSTILIYESRELFHSWPINFTNETLVQKIKSRTVRELEVRRERKNSKHIDYLITVNDSIAQILKKYFSLSTEPVVTRNIGHYEEIKKKGNAIRKKFKIAEDKKIIVYLGKSIYRKNLQIEKLITQISNNSKYVFVITAQKNERRKWFEDYIKEYKIKNIFFHDFVPIEDVVSFISSADIGVLSAWNKKDLSYWFALDNKLFSYIQAEIPTLASSQPEYKKIIDAYKVGVCINPDEANAFLNGIQKIIHQYPNYKHNLLHAKKDLCWEKEQLPLLDLYKNLIDRHK